MAREVVRPFIYAATGVVAGAFGYYALDNRSGPGVTEIPTVSCRLGVTGHEGAFRLPKNESVVFKSGNNNETLFLLKPNQKGGFSFGLGFNVDQLTDVAGKNTSKPEADFNAGVVFRFNPALGYTIGYYDQEKVISFSAASVGKGDYHISVSGECIK